MLLFIPQRRAGGQSAVTQERKFSAALKDKRALMNTYSGSLHYGPDAASVSS